MPSIQRERARAVTVVQDRLTHTESESSSQRQSVRRRGNAPGLVRNAGARAPARDRRPSRTEEGSTLIRSCRSRRDQTQRDSEPLRRPRRGHLRGREFEEDADSLTAVDGRSFWNEPHARRREAAACPQRSRRDCPSAGRNRGRPPAAAHTAGSWPRGKGHPPKRHRTGTTTHEATPMSVRARGLPGNSV